MRALVLSGGGNRGALQAGAVQVLLEAGLSFDLLVGTSVGAMNAAFLAAGPTARRGRELVRLWRDLRRTDLVADRPVQRAIRLLLRSDHLYSDAALRRLVATHCPYQRLEQAAVPLVVVAADLLTGEEVRLSCGPVVDAVVASAAIPGLFPPVPWDGRLLVDGGVVANLPLAAAVAAGADELWLLDTTALCSERRRPRHALDVALQAMAVLATARRDAELSCPPPGVTLHHLPLVCRRDRWFTDLSDTRALLADGAQAARAYLRGA